MRWNKKISAAWLVGALAVAVLLAGCGNNVSADSLTNTMWQLDEVNGRDVLDDVYVTMNLDPDDAMSGSAGCNRYFGTWQTGKGYDITVNATGTTMMACDQPIMDQEQDFLAALSSAVRFSLDRDTLRFYNAENREVAEFRKLKPALLRRTEWHATAINNGQGGVVPVLPDTVVSVIVDGSEDRISGNTGCNTYGADFTRDGDEFQIGPPMMTLIACDQPVMDQEAQFLQALERAQTYELGHETLYLRAEDGSLLVMFREND